MKVCTVAHIHAADTSLELKNGFCETESPNRTSSSARLQTLSTIKEKSLIRKSNSRVLSVLFAT